MIKTSGIYKIQSIKFPDRIYIGSACNVQKRWNRHLFSLRKGNHHSKKLQNHYNKYGESDLQFTLIMGCDKEVLLDTEQYFLDISKTYFNIYKSTRQYSTAKQSESTIQKRSKSMTGKKWTLEQRQRFSKQLKGKRIISKEARKKIATTLTGRKGTPCTERRKILLSESRKGVNNPMFGKKSWNSGLKMSKEYREKNSKAHKGLTPWNKGKKGVSKETSLKMSNSAIGKKRIRTPEHQKKMWESRRHNEKLRKNIA